MGDSSDEGILEGEDYYTFLNIPRNATDEDISNAYRRLSRLYHPDKHMNPERKKEAEVLFGKTKKAYEVLSDAHQRAIYDNLGVAGLATQGWEVVHRTKTPQEIREEYERLARDREERRLQQRTNPKSSASITINATELFAPVDDEGVYFDLRDIFGLPHVEISGIALSQSIEAPLTSSHTAVFGGNLSSHNGRGSGSLSCSLRRVISDRCWAEVEMGAGSGLNFGLKGFRSFSQGFFGNAGVQGNVTPGGIRLGSVVTLANQLDKHTVGYLTWKLGTNTGLNTMVIRDTEKLHAVISVHFGIPHTYLSASYVYKMPDQEAKLKLTGKVGTFGGQLEYSAEKKVSQHSHLSATMSVGVPLGVQLRLRLRRASQTYTSNIILCEELLPAPIVYGTLLPLLGWMALDRLVIRPFLDEQKKQTMARQRESNKARMSELKREAASAVELMRETVKRIIQAEENKKGLVILRAIHGRLVVEEDTSQPDDVVDVTIPLQCLVKDSKLILQEASKCQLPGFYDPCPGEDKSLHVQYLFHAVTHKVTVADNEGLRIPKQCTTRNQVNKTSHEIIQFEGEQRLNMAQHNGRPIQDNSVDVDKNIFEDGKRKMKEFLDFEIEQKPFWKSDDDGSAPDKYITDIVQCHSFYDKKSFDDEGHEIETTFIKSMSRDEDVGVQTEDEINNIRGTITDVRIQGSSLMMSAVQKRELETENMLKCWNFFCKIYNETRKTPLTQDIIKEGHTILMGGLIPNAGELSEGKKHTTCPTTNTTINYPRPEFVKNHFHTFMDYSNQINYYLDSEIREKGLKEELVELSVKFHAWFFISFIRLHPFSDGNGRLSRLLHAYLQLSISPAPVGIYNIFSKTSKSDYIRVIVEVRKQHEEHKCEEHWCYESKPVALSAMILECLYHTCLEIKRKLESGSGEEV